MIVAGIDAGTQSIKIIVYDSEKHKMLSCTSSPLSIIEEEGGVREQKAQWWIDALKNCFSSIASSVRKEIRAISVSGQQHGFVPLSKDGDVLYNVKLWCDTSTAEECREIEAMRGGRDSLSERTGNPIMPGYTASKIRWFWKNHRDLYEKMSYVLLPHDYLNWYLTGKVIMERGDASGTALMNIFTGQWDEATVEATAPGLKKKLPKIIENPDIIEKITAEASESLGLDPSCLIASGGGDNMMSAIGTGAVEEGNVTMSLGTSGTLFAFSSKPLHDEKNRLASFCSSTGGWLPLLCTMNCTVASETMRKLFNKDVKAFDEEAQKAGEGAGGLMMLPFLNGERVPNYPHGEGVVLGIRQSNMSEGNLARAALEGVTYEFLLGLDAFRENGIDVKFLTLTGGGAKSAVWRQIVADMTGCPVRVPSLSESAAFGAALHALWCAEGGRIEDITKEHIGFDRGKDAVPDITKKAIYEQGYRRWLKYSETLSPLFR